MASNDFNLDELAAYLHLNPSQISRMADRGQVPGRRIGGEWRFAEAEIHHWLEVRIGASDSDELNVVDSILDRAAGGDEEAISVVELLPSAAIAAPLEARTRSSVIGGMCQLAASTGLLWDPEKMESAVRDREELHPTAMDSGVALLHPRRPMPTILAEPILAFGRTDKGIPFGSSRGTPTDIFFLVCSTDDRNHLRLLARLSRLIGVPEFLSELRGAMGPREVLDVIERHDAAI